MSALFRHGLRMLQQRFADVTLDPVNCSITILSASRS